VAGLRTGFSSALYSKAKAALIQLGKSRRWRLRRSACASTASTQAVSRPQIFSRGRYGKGQGDQDDGTVKRLISYFAETLPLKRGGLAEDIAYGAVYLASDDSIFVTGHDLVIGSGMTVGRTVDERTASYQELYEAIQGD
jgi:NAD(P)-dependent dehydrogenase (short-subunit alcohol dehydrogenase family)